MILDRNLGVTATGHLGIRGLCNLHGESVFLSRETRVRPGDVLGR